MAGLESAAVAAPRERDVRLDVLRGLALVMIFLNHVQGNLFAQLTTRNFGFSDAAELFVFLAGFVGMMTFGRAFREHGSPVGLFRVLRRCWQLYIAHLLLLLAFAGATAWAASTFVDPDYYTRVNMAPFFFETDLTILRALTLTYLPNYMDILPLYVMLLFGFPLVFWLAEHGGRALALAVSLAVYAVSRTWGLNLPSYPDREWFFNPFVWQLVFTLGALAAHRIVLDGRPLPRGPLLTALSAAYLAYACLAMAPWNAWFGPHVHLLPEMLVPDLDKAGLAPARVLHVLALVHLLSVLVPRGAAWLRGPLAGGLAAMGRSSLLVFSLGVVLAFLGGVVLDQCDGAPVWHVLVSAGGIAAMVAAANASLRYRHHLVHLAR